MQTHQLQVRYWRRLFLILDDPIRWLLLGVKALLGRLCLHEANDCPGKLCSQIDLKLSNLILMLQERLREGVRGAKFHAESIQRTVARKKRHDEDARDLVLMQ